MDWIIGRRWKNIEKGLRKKVLKLQFTKVEKPTELSECNVQISNVTNLQNRASSYLSHVDDSFRLEMGTATTPVDCYVELIVQNMLLGETSRCTIQTKSGKPIIFEVTLNTISSSKYLFQLTVQEMYDLAQKYRANGVKMFKSYPLFAHDYFSRAAKLLISFKPFDVLTKESNGVDGSDMEALLHALQTNISACLLQQKRYEDVIHQTEFVDTLSSEELQKQEKAVYRRALAFLNLKEYEKALEVIDNINVIQKKKEFLVLHHRVVESWKRDEENYKSMVKKMFPNI